MEFELPRYSATAPAPDYSYEPGCGERTLQQAPRSSRQVANSSLIKHSGKTTVVLHNQVERAKIPSYGRGAAISGSLLFDTSDNISEVALQVYIRIQALDKVIPISKPLGTDLRKNRNYVNRGGFDNNGGVGQQEAIVV